MLCVVRGGSWVAVDEATFQTAVHQHSEFSRGGRDRFGFTNAEGQAPVERTESGLGTAETHRGQSQDRSGAIGRGDRLRAEKSPT